MRHLSLASTFGLVVALGSACSPGSGTTSNTDGDDPANGGNGAGTNQGAGENNGANGQGGDPTMGQFVDDVGGGTPTNCDSGPDEDLDEDGWSVTDGDCNDCDPNTNPGAIEVIGTAEEGEEYVPVDEDCDLVADNPPEPCDGSLPLDASDPFDGARAMELCKLATDNGYGVISAKYVRANGDNFSSSLQNGILERFGPNVPPRGGGRMLALSSGHARLPGQSGACGNDSCSDTGAGDAPAGFPQTAAGCEIDGNIFDDVGLEVQLRAPTNATGYSFDFKFYSFEFAEWVCTPYNDQFMALVTPAPAGAQDGNISFDSNGAPVSVNLAYFTVAENCNNWAANSDNPPPQPNPCAPSGPAELAGTGFDIWTDNGFPPFFIPLDDGNAGGTSWLQTTAPVAGGEEVTIRFAIWDTGDENLDATSVIDNFKWVANGGEVNVGTEPAPPQ